MPETIFIGVAWPYANGSLHLGQIAGAYLPPDIFARYHRAAGNRVLMVSGSDQHGTPITVRAEQEGLPPQAIVDRFQAEFVESWKQLGITFDLYTSTGTKNHEQTVHEMFLRLLQKGHIYKGKTLQFFDSQAGRFLPDRYVEGTCPRCGYARARGDQCDNCGSTLDATDLIDPVSRISRTKPELRESEHFFFRQSAFNEPLLQWLSTGKEHWRPHVRNFSLGLVREGLPDRAITRDLEWGVRLPVEDLGEGKRIYVWYEALMGYLSASKEWAQRQGDPEAWRDFWEDPACKSYYFIGKDNIVFHTIIWPAWLMAYGGLNLPYDVPANQYVNFGGGKASTSLGTAPFLPNYINRYEADTIRYYLAAIMPETSDSEFSEEDLVRRNNEELVATWGNLVNRVLSPLARTYGGLVPEPGALKPSDEELIARGDEMLRAVGGHIAACHFRDGLRVAMAYGAEANRYLSEEAPWKAATEGRAEDAARAYYTALCAVEALKVGLYPYLPFSSQELHSMLGHGDTVAEQGWQVRRPKPGAALGKPQPLFRKLELPTNGGGTA
ncbi:MAG TPA: methionine--tRNA ligase [Dehalococcoidia bacterium]|nr:methionine--tRNA ligase [Dehalococcoidia bacterium]